MARFLYFFLYLLFMLPTYLLPYLGSNSAIVHSFVVGASRNGEDNLSIYTLIHIGSLTILVLLAALRGRSARSNGLFAFPLCAGVFDFLPILSSIPFVPTALHLVALIKGMHEPPETDVDFDRDGMKKCLQCAEFVKQEALICRYCGSNQPPSLNSFRMR